MHYKDGILDRVAHRANVAQFVSFAPDLTQRFSRVLGFHPNERFGSITQAIETLLAQTVEKSVNVRSFDPANSKSREFVYGLTSTDAAESALKRLSASGLHTIVNETIDVNDGGVSGVALGSTLEFAPGDTPRAVEKPGIAAFPREIGLRLLKTIYGFAPALRYEKEQRVEFSIHPIRRGYRNAHTVVWELERVRSSVPEPTIEWPNRFSRFIGDKCFGLLIAELVGLPVPHTIAVCRGIAPFQFGRRTRTNEYWLRTSPSEAVPGKFTTRRGWVDPYRLLQLEDPAGEVLQSVLAQEGVDALYSGALLADKRGKLTIEGVHGFGDQFMVGIQRSEKLPPKVLKTVRALYARSKRVLGPIRIEWVVDRKTAWIVQVHRGSTPSHGRVIVPGRGSKRIVFDVTSGLEALRRVIDQTSGEDVEIVLSGGVGITSHFGDVLRKARIPSRIASNGDRKA